MTNQWSVAEKVKLSGGLPPLGLTHGQVVDVLDDVAPVWRSGKDLVKDLGSVVLDGLIGDRGLSVESILSFIVEINIKDDRGVRIGGSFPVLLDIAETWLRDRGITSPPRTQLPRPIDDIFE